MSPSTPRDSRSEQAKARAAAHAEVSMPALPSSAAQEVRFSPSLWQDVSRRRRSPPTTALPLLQQGPRTSPFGQVSRAPGKSILSVSVQREVGSLSQELCHHPSTRTQGWCRQPTERRHGVATHQQQSPTGVHHWEVQIGNPHIGGHLDNISTANPRLPRTPAVAHDARWWPWESRRRPHLHLRELKGNGRRKRPSSNTLNAWESIRKRGCAGIAEKLVPAIGPLCERRNAPFSPGCGLVLPTSTLTGHARIWPNRIWPKPHLARKIRIGPICFRDRIWPNRIWPELVFQSVDRIWPNRIWPILVF